MKNIGKKLKEHRQKIPIILVLLVGLAFLLWFSREWAITCFKPFKPFERTVPAWIPYNASVVNPLGEVPWMKTGGGSSIRTTFLPSLVDFGKLAGRSRFPTTVVFNADGKVYYSSQIGGFQFVTEDDLTNSVGNKEPTAMLESVVLKEDYKTVLHYEKSWGFSIFAFCGGLIIVWIITGAFLFLTCVGIYKFSEWGSRQSGQLKKEPPLATA